MLFKSNIPYPKIRVEKPNVEYAKLLLKDYANHDSEETAIHMYLYQSLVLKEDFKELSDVLLNISKVEMEHLRLLGETIFLLGLNPMYGLCEKDIFIPWNTSYVPYPDNLEEMLVDDIQREMDAIRNYQCHYLLIEDEYIRELLEKIIQDEKIHLEIFKYYYKKYFK